MFIIWGSRFMKSTLAQGRFYCPQCDQTDIGYKHRGGRSWFTLYFIPIFPIGSTTEYIECDRCSGTFKKEVLEIEPPTAADRLAREYFGYLAKGMSLETAIEELTERDLPAEKAKAFIEAITGDDVWGCAQCGQRYVKGVKTCRECKVR